jgi:hypothetical protein
VGETSSHALSMKYGRSGKRSAREGPVYHFSQKDTSKSSARQRSLRTLAKHLMAQLPSLQRPCIVKASFKERYWYEFD